MKEHIVANRVEYRTALLYLSWLTNTKNDAEISKTKMLNIKSPNADKWITKIFVLSMPEFPVSLKYFLILNIAIPRVKTEKIWVMELKNVTITNKMFHIGFAGPL